MCRSSAGARFGGSTPYGASSPYSAFAQHVKQVARIFDNDELEEAGEKLRSAVESLVGEAEAEQHTEHLAMLVGLGGSGEAADRETLFFSARVLLESLAAQCPTMLLFEDIHWADGSLLDLIETLAARVRDVPLLLVALARPELRSERPTWGGGLPAYTALPLDPLSESDAQELAERHLDRAGATAEQAEAVARTGEGNPLFIEELAASLVERSTLDAGLPTSVRAIVAARLDALPPAERRVLVDAAVVGRVFWRGAVARLSPEADLASALGSLEERDFVRREAVSRITGEQQFAFKHGVIREVAYERLPRAERREAARRRLIAGYTSRRRLAAARSVSRTRRSRTTGAREDRERGRASTQRSRGLPDRGGRPWPGVDGPRSTPSRSIVPPSISSPRDDERRRREVSRNSSPLHPRWRCR